MGHVKEVLMASTEKVLRRKKSSKVPWITKKVVNLCELRWKLRLQRLTRPTGRSTKL